MPDLGFLFPVFNDRSTDIHSLLYYTKNAEQLRSAFVDEMFGCTTPLSAGGQRDSFNALVEETLGDDCAYDTVMNIHEKLNEWVDSQKDSPDPAVLTKPEVKRLFEECGVEDENSKLLIRPMKQLPVKTLHLWSPILPIHDVLRSKHRIL